MEARKFMRLLPAEDPRFPEKREELVIEIRLTKPEEYATVLAGIASMAADLRSNGLDFADEAYEMADQLVEVLDG